jgi:hypothetical protein
MAAALTLPQVALAHTLSLHKARSAALEAGRELGKQTNAYKTRLSGCRRRSSHRVDCKVENLYRNGSDNCTTDIEVRFASRTSPRVRAIAHQTLCY